MERSFQQPVRHAAGGCFDDSAPDVTADLAGGSGEVPPARSVVWERLSSSSGKLLASVRQQAHGDTQILCHVSLGLPAPGSMLLATRMCDSGAATGSRASRDRQAARGHWPVVPAKQRNGRNLEQALICDSTSTTSGGLLRVHQPGIFRLQ